MRLPSPAPGNQVQTVPPVKHSLSICPSPKPCSGWKPNPKASLAEDSIKDALQFPVQPSPSRFPAWPRAGGSPAAAPPRAAGRFPRVEAMATGGRLALVTPQQELWLFSAWGCRDLGCCRGTHGFHSTALPASPRRLRRWSRRSVASSAVLRGLLLPRAVRAVKGSPPVASSEEPFPVVRSEPGGADLRARNRTGPVKQTKKAIHGKGEQPRTSRC